MNGFNLLEKHMTNMYQNHLKYNPKYPQSFTGKERDSETGFSYFGAWLLLGADPLRALSRFHGDPHF